MVAWIQLAAVFSVLAIGCSNSLPNTRAMVHESLRRADAENHGEAARYGAEDVKAGNVDGQGPTVPLGPDTEAAIGARLQRFLLIEREVAGTPLLGGNKVMLLQNGAAAYTAMFTALRNAKSSINLETFIFTDDDVGQKFAALLTQARRRGVVVNVMYDSFGSLSTKAEFFEGMRQAGISVVEFNPIGPLAVAHFVGA